MFQKYISYGLRGMDSFPVYVEADMGDGLPSFVMVGYLSEAVREAHERVRTSLRNSGLRLPPRKITVNLSPAGIRKDGTAYDLAIAAAVAGCILRPEEEAVSRSAFFGELGLDGTVKPVDGAVSRVFAAKKDGIKRVFLPSENVREGQIIEGVELVGIHSLTELIHMLSHPGEISGVFSDLSLFSGEAVYDEAEDFRDIVGLSSVRRATEACAAGHHNILYIGPAGTGKTMTARRIPGILPPLSLEESMEMARIWSIAGLIDRDQPLKKMRPFRAPHHTISRPGLLGGGFKLLPGEISLAAHGVLFLDELPEYEPRLLDSLRQPLEDGKIIINRLSGSATYPADGILAAAMNPCPCGAFPDISCTCGESKIRNYLNRVSGPLLDRFDIGVEVPRQDPAILTEGKKGESSADIRKRVMMAVRRQEERFSGTGILFNGQMKGSVVRDFCRLGREEKELLEKILKKSGQSARGHDKILSVARTLADLDDSDQILKKHLLEAGSYRSFAENYWGKGY